MFPKFSENVNLQIMKLSENKYQSKLSHVYI